MKPQQIDDPGDPRIEAYRGVRDRVWLDERGWFVAEGRSVLELVLDSPRFRVDSVLLSASAYRSLEPSLARRAAREEAASGALQVFVCSRAVMRATSGVPFHQGAVALVRRPEPSPTAEQLAPRSVPRLRLLVADAVTDPDNVGALFRNAFAFAGHGVLLDPRCASPYYRKAVRTSLGATLRVPFAHARIWPQPLDAWREAGVALLGLSLDRAAVPLPELGLGVPVPERLALCVGNEGYGLSEVLLERCTLRLRIPMAPGADSVNVATAAGIALQRLFELDAAI